MSSQDRLSDKNVRNVQNLLLLFYFMIRPTDSEEYTTIRLSYPEHYNKKCPICKSDVRFQYANGGKLVYCLDGTIYQIINLYTCTNTECSFSKKPFNPTIRFDYGGRSWGSDVLRYIANLFLLAKMTPSDIHDLLKLEYPSFEISIDSICRMTDDILLLKAHSIDNCTFDIISKQGMILLGVDGQNPGGNGPSLWLFMDLLSGRVLSTQLFTSLNHNSLNEYIQNLLAKYNVPLVGWVSDKQGLLVKCHDTYYPEVPMQYCQFHFLSHLWNHLECYDSNIFMPLKTTISNLYIRTSSQKVYYEGKGKIEVKEAFKDMNDEFQDMISVRNKKFKTLRGVWLYETLSNYLEGLIETVNSMNPNLRGTIQMRGCYDAIHEVHSRLYPIYQNTVQLLKWFESIRSSLSNAKISVDTQETICISTLDEIFNHLVKEDPYFNVGDCRSFLPNKNSPYNEVLGEYLRLWKSYSHGLFQYAHFPKPVRTNGDLERTFSRQKTRLIARAGKGNVSHMIATRGEAYIRIHSCKLDELMRDIILDFEEDLLQDLRRELDGRIKDQTKKWRTMSRTYHSYQKAAIYFDEDFKIKKTKMEVR